MPKLAVPKKSCVTERHRSHERLDRGVLLALDERLGIEPGQFAQLAQEQRRAFQPDRRLEIRPLERLAQPAAEFAVEADIDLRVGQLADVGEVAAEREDHLDLGADPLDQAADLGEVGRAC